VSSDLSGNWKRPLKSTIKKTLKGIGDDAAVVNLNNDENVQLITTDMLLEGVHFDLVYCPLKHLGYKAVVVNLSDIYAMNGQPKQIVVGLGIEQSLFTRSH
jgi:thiamine-monophosphate kinase